MLKAVSEDLDSAADPGAPGVLHTCGLNGHTGDTEPLVSQPATPAVESDAVLWAMHNLWFGVEEEMTAAAYKVWSVLARLNVPTWQRPYHN